jgi:hypothetical protein
MLVLIPLRFADQSARRRVPTAPTAIRLLSTLPAAGSASAKPSPMPEGLFFFGGHGCVNHTPSNPKNRIRPAGERPQGGARVAYRGMGICWKGRWKRWKGVGSPKKQALEALKVGVGRALEAHFSRWKGVGRHPSA